MRDSHGLFDYESRNISKKNLKTKYVGKIIRQQNTIEFISPSTNIEDLPGYNKEEFLTLAQIKQDNSKCKLSNINLTDNVCDRQRASTLSMETQMLRRNPSTDSGLW